MNSRRVMECPLWQFRYWAILSLLLVSITALADGEADARYQQLMLALSAMPGQTPSNDTEQSAAESSATSTQERRLLLEHMQRHEPVSSNLPEPKSALAACNNQIHLTLEGARQEYQAAPLNDQGLQFATKDTASGALRLDQRCNLGTRYSTRIKATLGGGYASSEAGRDQSKPRKYGRAWLHEAYLTVEAPGEILLDLGKKDINNGYLLFLSPMDILRTPINLPVHNVINVEGASWRNSYREGRIGLRASKFLDWGTLELAFFPALDKSPRDALVSKWRTLQRNNDSDTVYAAYSANLWEAFNPKLLLRSSDGREHTAAIGVSDSLSDSIIFSLEAAYANRSQIYRVSPAAVDTLVLGGFPQADEVFEPTAQESMQFAAGLRIDGPFRTTLIGEFYYQSEGYGNRNWEQYFQFADYVRAAYASSGFAPYRDYQHLLLSTADSEQRKHLLLGRRYLTLGLERRPVGTGWLGWHLSALGNVDDKSTLLNAHLSAQLASRLELYLGGRVMIGGQRTEFGRFGRSPLLYLGLDMSL